MKILCCTLKNTLTQDTGRVNSERVIEVFEKFAEKMTLAKYGSGDHYTIVMVDNASIHTSKLFKEKLSDWMIKRKLIVCYLPTYSPELNLVEILWRTVKYEWFNLFNILDFKSFEGELIRVFKELGQEYWLF